MDLIQTFKARCRHPFRPRSSDIIQRLFTDFREYPAKGDSLIMGEGHLGGRKVYVVAQQKPKPEWFASEEDIKRLNWGMMNADEHSQVLGVLRDLSMRGPHEEAWLLSLVDTYGADISMYSARRLQAFFIAHLIQSYLTVPIRTVSVVIGEGGSGGALAVQVADRRAALEDAVYNTAPPESMASIIFRDSERIGEALAISRGTHKYLRRYRVVDGIIPQAQKVTDANQVTANIKTWLDKTVKDLFKRRLDRLLARRLSFAGELGVVEKGHFFEIKRFIEKPLKQLQRPPQGIQIVDDAHGSGLHLDDTYGDGTVIKPGAPHVICGEETKAGGGEGCGKAIPLDSWLGNHQVCAHCGKRHVLDAQGWINALADEGSFHELFRNMTVHDLLAEGDLHDYYKTFLEKQAKRTSFTESLVTAKAAIYGYPVVLALAEFAFAGGTLGVVFGEKFRLACDYAIRRHYPLISVCCSGGARLYEGIVALMQMTKTVASVEKLKRAGIPFFSILADPSTGGAIASYAALGDVCIAEPGAMVIFTGPRVMAARGFEVQEEMVRAEHLCQESSRTLEEPEYFGPIRGIQEVVPRGEMRRALSKYLELFARTRSRERRRKGVRPYVRRIARGVF